MATGSGISAQLGGAEEVYVNEVQQISGTPSGTFGLNFDGALTTVSLATNASAANIQAALEALPNIGTGGVVCAGGALPAAVTVTFSGTLVKQRNVPLLSVQGAITGLTFATNTPGTGYGDAVTVSRFLEFTGESLKLSIDRNETNGMRSGNRFQRTDRWAPGKRQAAGDIEMEVPSKGFSMFLGQALGSAPIITTPSGATATRDHTVTVGDTSGRSMTLQTGVPDVFGVVDPFTYVGCKFTQWEFDLAVDQLLTFKGSVDAQNEVTSVGLAVASYATTFEMLYWAGGQATIGGANVDVRSAKITGNMGLNVGRFFNRSATTAGGPTLKKEPIANGLAEIMIELDLEWESYAQYNRFTGGTTAAVTLLVEGSIIEAGGGATINPRFGLLLTLPFVRFDGDTPDDKDMDVTDQVLKCKALWDGTTQPLTVRYRTTDTSV